MLGDFANLLIEEKESVTWQSVIRQMPRHVLAFATRLSTNSLNSPDNLARWGKRNMGSCPLCKGTQGTLAHIAMHCDDNCPATPSETSLQVSRATAIILTALYIDYLTK